MQILALNLHLDILLNWSFFIYWTATTKNDLGGSYPILVIVMVLFSETILSIYDKKIKYFGPTGRGILLAWFSEVIFTAIFPHISPASHQLLPLEPVIFILVIVPTTVIGSMFGKIISNTFLGNQKPISNTWMLPWPFVIGLILALASPIVTPLEKGIKEYRARTKVIEITHAQFKYYHDNPDEGYTCDLSKLMGGKSYKEKDQQGMAYEVQYEWGYAHRLWCHSDTQPRDTFYLSISPYSVTTSGDVAYCSDETGLVRSTPRRNESNWRRYCRESINIIKTIATSDQH